MEDFFKWFTIIGKYNGIFLDKELAKFGLNSSHHPYIMCICAKKTVTQEYLRKIMHVNPSNITRSLDFLEKNDFIVKEKSNIDKRTCNIVPTEKALSIYKEIKILEKSWYNSLLENFSVEEKQNLEFMVKSLAITILENFNNYKQNNN